MENHDGSVFLHEEDCECGGSGGKRYTDGHFYCFSCGKHERGEGTSTPSRKRDRVSGDMIEAGEFKALPKRHLTLETCRKFGYSVGFYKGQTVQIQPYYDKDGELCAQQLRFANKDFVILGDLKSAVLDGQHLWEGGGRKIVVTEGAIDKMTVSQLQNNKWPVVSIPNGVQSAKKALAAQLDWLCSFEEVILMFDMDKPGRDAVAECAPIFPPGKCKIASLPMKDPSELMQAGKGEVVLSAMWQAKTYRPDGIVTLADLREKLMEVRTIGLPWFLDTLTKLTFGRRFGEIYAYGAGTGVGKTDFLTQQVTFDINVLKEKVGLFALEQMPTETGWRVAGKFAGKRFHIPDGTWTPEELSEALDQLDATGSLFLYDSFGATEWDVIASTIRFLAHSEGVRLFYIDNLTALAAAAEDERKALETIMAEMGALVKELDIIINIVSHLATPEGKPHEEGGRVMIRHFKGSRAIGFWCHFMFGLERDQQADDPVKAQTTTFRCLKDRFTGQATGKTLLLGYDSPTGRLFEKPPEEADHGFKDETKSDF